MQGIKLLVAVILLNVVARAEIATAPKMQQESQTQPNETVVWSGGIARMNTVKTATDGKPVVYYMVDVVLFPGGIIGSGLATDMPNAPKTRKTSVIAKHNNAVVAVNGDYYLFRSSGYVVRNGKVLRGTATRHALAIDAENQFIVFEEKSKPKKDIKHYRNVFSFGPILVDGGKIGKKIKGYEVDIKATGKSIQGRNPRTGICQVSQNRYMFFVVDGRRPTYSIGMTLREFAAIMIANGCITGYNLDGGGSSTLYFNGKVINKPSDGGERRVPDIVYVK